MRVGRSKGDPVYGKGRVQGVHTTRVWVEK